jgi:hypothetical protein
MEHSSGGFGKAQELCIDPVKDQTSVVSKTTHSASPLRLTKCLRNFPWSRYSFESLGSLHFGGWGETG